MSHIADALLHLHGLAVLAVVFALPALESSAFVGFVFPGEIAVILGGVLAYEHRATLWGVIVAAILGAVLGDAVGYFVGKRWGRRILLGAFGRILKAEHLDRAEAYVTARGGRAVFFGRFTAALRVMVPGLAGMSGMEYRTFAAYNFAGGAIWATGFVLAGYAAGSGWRRVEHFAGRASLLLLALATITLAGVALATWLRNNRELVRAWRDRQVNRPTIRRLSARYQTEFRFVANRFRPEGALGLTLTLGLVAIGTAGWAFGSIAQDVLVRDDLAGVDGPLQRFLLEHREPWLTTLQQGIARAASAPILLPVVLVLGLALAAHTRTPRPVLLLATAALGAIALVDVVKPLVARVHPAAVHLVGDASGWSFPSGEATLAAALFGMLAVLLASTTRSWTRKVTLWSTAVLLSLIVGFARMYLGVHWLTDVLGGYALGALWLFVVVTATGMLDRAKRGGDKATTPAEAAPPMEATAPRS